VGRVGRVKNMDTTTGLFSGSAKKKKNKEKKKKAQANSLW